MVALIATVMLPGCGDSPTGDGDGNGGPPTVGSIQVTTTTTGPGLDPDGYTVTVDGNASQSIGANATVTFSDLDPGNHMVELTAVGSNCPVSSENPQTVSVTAGDTRQAIFNVVCGYLAYVANRVGRVSVIATANNKSRIKI